MTKNEFIAFKGLFNEELSNAIVDGNVELIEDTLVENYSYEIENNLFKDTGLDINIIQENYRQHCEDIDNDPSLIHKL